MSELDRKKWVIDAAEYLHEKRRRDELADGRQLLPGEAQNKREELKGKLETALRKSDALVKALEPLHRELQLGLDQFGSMADRINEAWNSALQAQTECRIALTDTLPAARTREMKLHQAAVRLAVAYEPGTGASSLAREIMTEAGLDEPGQSTLTRWIEEARQS
ncbi:MULTISPECIES: hypothetical protein [unclassified Marinobacter]|jgi:hypothetical protein|uniref:hypothetical protein n=1 Tax=unclassified Marinobacter TaxID=83889 RepID=UPI00200E2635|nr:MULTISPECIES: hypothetical protein [unclassified Marinobacter]MCL1488437.1 hypothetical protein [Marinobacter sp.]UQG57131.1 hypothetical protein MIH16_05655 [Marinobacter sp. M4C]UQG65935.1 hypothetical protein MIH17_05655 [Marinobacter sp. M2C]UQG70215.1 hypothetical protein MIH19_05650 [Marinobacter sp. M1C]